MSLLYRSITILLELIEILIVVRILLSFLNIFRESLLTSFIYEITEPVLGPARDLLAKLNINTGMFDFSPLVAILFLRIAHELVNRIFL